MSKGIKFTKLEIATATRLSAFYEHADKVKARLGDDGWENQTLRRKRLVEAGIMEVRKKPYRQISVRRGPAWDNFYSKFGLRDTKEGLQRIEIGEMIDRKFGPMIHAAFNPNVLPFRRPPNAPTLS